MTVNAIGIIVPLDTPGSAKIVAAYETAIEQFGNSIVGLLKKTENVREFYVSLIAKDQVQAFIEAELADCEDREETDPNKEDYYDAGPGGARIANKLRATEEDRLNAIYGEETE